MRPLSREEDVPISSPAEKCGEEEQAVGDMRNPQASSLLENWTSAQKYAEWGSGESRGSLPSLSPCQAVCTRQKLPLMFLRE